MKTRRWQDLFQNFVGLPVLIFTFLFLFEWISGTAFAQQQWQNIEKEFKNKTTFYLDQKVQTFLHQMIRREKLLLGMVQNVITELEHRGIQTIQNKDVPFAELYDRPDVLIKQYNEEIDKLSVIIDQVDLLQMLVRQQERLHLQQPLENLMRTLTGVLNDGRFIKHGLYSSNELWVLIVEYNHEIDALLALYDRLTLVAEIETGFDNKLVRETLKTQQAEISKIFDGFASLPQDSTGREFALEIGRIKNVLHEIRKLKLIARKTNIDVELALNRVRVELLANLNERVAVMLELDEIAPFSYPLAVRVFNDWKTKELIEYRVAFTRNRIIKHALLASASAPEKSRMLEMDLEDALSSYIEKDFRLSAQRLTWVLQDYERDFSLESVHFYRGECYYARRRYHSAQSDYQAVVNAKKVSEFKGESLFRLMQIADKQKNYAHLERCYRKLEKLPVQVDEQLLTRARFLAGYTFLNGKNFTGAETALKFIPKVSPYYFKAQYLRAIAFAGKNQYDSAIPIFQFLAQRTTQTGSDDLRGSLIDESLLKLGYIFFEMEDYRRSLTYFNLMTDHHNYDRSRLGVAWAYFKLGKFIKAITNARAVLDEDATSEHSYEALVLSAQAWRELDNDDTALSALGYVANAQQVFDIAARLNLERLTIAKQINTFVQLERIALEHSDIDAYADVVANRTQLENVLREFSYRGNLGGALVDEFAYERDMILEQVSELDRLMVQAFNSGATDVMQQTDKQRQRLLKALDTYQADLNIQNKHFFTDYPNSVAELVDRYRNDLLGNLVTEVGKERQFLQADLDEIDRLRVLPGLTKNHKTQVVLELLADNLTTLQSDNEVFNSWLLNNGVEINETNFTYWANISGIGISDITMKRIHDVDDHITELAFNTNFVDKILLRRKDFLQQRVLDYDELIHQLEYELNIKHYEEYQETKDNYFRENYFDKQEREQANNQ